MPLKRRFQFFSLILISGLFVALLAHGYVGLFSRYWYDDFCTAAILRDQGFIDFQRFWYITWSGRFSFHLLVSIVELFGPRAVSLLPATALTVWVVAATWTIYQICVAIRFPQPRLTSLVVALTIVFATIHSTPDVVQSLYWQTGMLTYLGPLLLMTIYLGVFVLVLRKKPGGRALIFWAIFGALFTFLAGGLSETYSLLQVAVLAVLLLASSTFFPKHLRRAAISMAGTALLAAVLALSIVVAAPGNRNRRAAFSSKPAPQSWLKSTASYTLYFIESHTRRAPATAVLCLLLPAWLVFAARRVNHNSSLDFPYCLTILKGVKLIGLSSAVAFFLIAICFVPAYLITPDGLPARGQIVPVFILIIFMTWFGFLCALAAANYFNVVRRPELLFLTAISVIVLVLGTLVPLRAAWQTFALGRTARTYASRWDALERQMRGATTSGARELVLPKINANNWNLGFGRIDMQPAADPEAGPNRCLARYYEVESVRVE